MNLTLGKLVPSMLIAFPLFLLSVAALAQEPPITGVAFAPDGKSVVACSQTGLQVFSWPEMKLVKVAKASASNLHSLAFSPDGKKIAVGGGDPAEEGTAEFFSWPEVKSLSKLSGHSDSITSAVWHNESRLVTASLDREVKIWDLNSQKVEVTCRGHSRGINSICVLNDGTIVTAGHDQSIRVWNSQSGQLVRSLNQHTKPVNALALRPTKKGLPMVASASSDRTVRLWQPNIGRMVRYVRLESEPLCVAWIDKTFLAASCVDGQVRIIQADNVEVTRKVAGIAQWAYAIAVHPSDGSLVIAGAEGQIKRVEIK